MGNKPKDVEEAVCRVCGAIFLKRSKSKNRKLQKGIRPMQSVTCSRQCSRKRFNDRI